MAPHTEFSNNKPHLKLIIGSDFHLRSFFSSQLFYELKDSFEIELLLSDKIQNSAIPSNVIFKTFKTSKLSNELFSNLLDSSMIRNISKSSSFRFRFKRLIMGDLYGILPFRPRGVLRAGKALIMSLPLIYGLIKILYKREVLKSIGTIDDLSPTKPEIICAWAQSIEPSAMLAVYWAEAMGSHSVLVFDNWDNLSSKAALVKLPDFVVCFGPQSAEFASKIHGMPQHRVYPIGSARFDTYLTGNLSKQKEKSVLIAGSSLALEDLAILKAISEIWQAQSKYSIFRQYAYVYRPHPVPQGSAINMEQFSFPGIEIDRDFMQRNHLEARFQSQAELAESLKKHTLVIGSPTTLILEALLCDIPVLIPTFGSGTVRTSNATMLRNLEHLKLIDQIENVYFCNSVKVLENMILEVLNHHIVFTKSRLLPYLVTTSPGTFSQRFRQALTMLK